MPYLFISLVGSSSLLDGVEGDVGAYKEPFGNLYTWLVGKGDFSFWNDNWCREFNLKGVAPDTNVATLLNEFWHEDHWDFHAIAHSLSSDWLQRVISHSTIITEEDDKTIWRLVYSRVFSTKSAWEDVCYRGTTNPVIASVWGPSIPLQSRIVVWKLLNNILLVELKVKATRYQLASCCVYCSGPNEESLQHLFLEGDMASSL